MNLDQVASTISTSCNIGDLATQLRCSEKELRGFLVRQGQPLDFNELRDSLSKSHDLKYGQYLEGPDGQVLLDEAHAKAKRHAVRHHQTYRIQAPDQPFLVTFWGDWHIGEAGTDHLRLKEDAIKLSELRHEIGESSVLIGMGDYIGGYMKSKTPSNNAQILSPSEQRSAALGLLRMTRPELIIQGDHDEWHNRMDSEHEWLQDLCVTDTLRYAQWGAGVEVATNFGTTRLLARHRVDGSRKVNPFLPQINLHSEWGPADVVAVAHYHSNPGVSLQNSRRIREGKFHAVQSGTYKQFDDYGKKLGVGNGEYGVPSVLVIPEEGEIIALPDLNDAIRTARSLCR